MENLIEVKNLKKYFSTPRGELHAVDNVSLNIEKGKTIGIVGESGCGKSTLGKTLMRLHNATSGQVLYNGVDIANMPMKEFKKDYRSNIQMIFQDPYSSLDPRMNVLQLIEEPIKVNMKNLSKIEIKEKAQEMMELVGLAKRLENSYPHELDGGRRQRIGIARALSLNPDFIVCDEPVSALDVSIQAQILNLLQNLQAERGLTYMFITHDMSVVKHISDDIAVMYLGQVIEKCPANEIFKHTIHPYSQALLSAIPIPNVHVKKERMILRGELTSPINPKKCCRFVARCPYATEKCHNEEPELRELKTNHSVACHYAEKFM
ncbi:ABC transporter ATP-binding protein [Anaerobium acetethylicum]|uniref:Oligopeptide/dipeptide ABC transporter, ATP-binding protein, C-terminal domain-containing protein n=1 Tax=Anaerobium acetethylicum TaxID=1619234 RepID=A0A1D3TQN7_9FIRM|nr:oligopeptide/dipeptide ABC transporter ATP-binding protein [Anaerobium acetethylicum]SCP95830.1 oligopeptide/dipeptide ABC transporter, ATP-binding protein, C-terminal domain-containing protein [Anaerobium acetethylicum]